jgi:hypothetical protein
MLNTQILARVAMHLLALVVLAGCTVSSQTLETDVKIGQLSRATFQDLTFGQPPTPDMVFGSNQGNGSTWYERPGHNPDIGYGMLSDVHYSFYHNGLDGCLSAHSRRRKQPSATPCATGKI